MTERVLAQTVAHAASDLLLRDTQRRDNVMTSLTHVPGAAVRGHLAARWIARHGAPDARFHDLFDRGQVVFCHAHPVLDGMPTIPAPLTLRTCKTHRFTPDHLAASTALYADLPACPHPSHGPGGATRRVKGYVTEQGRVLEPGALRAVRSRIGTEDDRLATGVAADAALFTEVRLPAGTQFLIRIEGPLTPVEQLLDLLDPNDDVITVGRSRTVMGRLDTGTWSVEPAVAATATSPAGDAHTLTFATDTILLDRLQRSVVGLTDPRALADVLADELGAPVSPDMFEILPGSQVRPTRVGGWDARARGPKPVDVAVAAGSTIAFRTDEDHLLTQLAGCSRMGWRQPEGFGQTILDHPVHALGQLPPTDVATVEVDGRRDRLARRAQDIAIQLGHQQVSRTLWQGIEETVRRGEVPAATPERERSEHASSSSGRGAGAGSRQRDRRRAALSLFEAATAELGVAVPSQDAVLLADDIGRELDLLNLDRR